MKGEYELNFLIIRINLMKTSTKNVIITGIFSIAGIIIGIVFGENNAIKTIENTIEQSGINIDITQNMSGIDQLIQSYKEKDSLENQYNNLLNKYNELTNNYLNLNAQIAQLSDQIVQLNDQIKNFESQIKYHLTKEEPSDLILIPNLVGFEEQEAVNLLTSIGLKSSVYWIQGNDETADQYFIVNQSIPEGSFVSVGTVIELEHSSKQPGTLVEVPNVIGMEQNKATIQLMKNGLQFKVWWTEDDNDKTSSVYYIKDQSIKEGTIVSAGTVVKLELTTVNSSE